MKKRFMSGFPAVLLALVMAGCPSDLSFNSPTDPANPIEPTKPGSIQKEFWGEWLRMDTGETWYITSSAIKTGNSVSSKLVSLSKQSDRVIEVTEAGRKYYLYASRTANAGFTGKIAGFQQRSQRGISGGGLGGIGVTISNLNDQTEVLTTTTDANGNFRANGIIPGDEYKVTPEGGIPTAVTPIGDGDDVGTITITDGLNFKTSIKPKSSSTDMSRLYANMYAYELNIEIKRITSFVTFVLFAVKFRRERNGVLARYIAS